MRVDKIFKRENGVQYQITISFWVDSYSEVPRWDIGCYCKDKGQKKWRNIHNTLVDYEFRSLSMEDRRKHTDKNILRFVTPEEILSVKMELWNKLKPSLQ